MEKDRYMLFELKHNEHLRPLSLSTVPIARQLKADSSAFDVQVAIVTNSMVSDTLKDGLSAEAVPIIEYSTEEQAAQNIWDFISDEADTGHGRAEG